MQIGPAFGMPKHECSLRVWKNRRSPRLARAQLYLYQKTLKLGLWVQCVHVPVHTAPPQINATK